jgi:hypothetical protein
MVCLSRKWGLDSAEIVRIPGRFPFVKIGRDRKVPGEPNWPIREINRLWAHIDRPQGLVVSLKIFCGLSVHSCLRFHHVEPSFSIRFWRYGRTPKKAESDFIVPRWDKNQHSYAIEMDIYNLDDPRQLIDNLRQTDL